MWLSSVATLESGGDRRGGARRAPLVPALRLGFPEAVTEAAIDEAVAGGYSALVLTVDVPYLGRRERDLRIDFKVPEH